MKQAEAGKSSGQVETIRAFNRFYTVRLGLLRRRHLDGRFSLTEARALFEIGSRPGVTAKAIREVLEIDNGYLSRVLAQHVRDGLVRVAESRADRREKLLSLTAAGRREVAHLDQESARKVEELLEPLGETQRAELAQILERAQTLLARPQQLRVSVERLWRVEPAALELMEEYYESINVVKRDDARALQRILKEPHGALWVASLDGRPVGCVMVRDLPQRTAAAECKRLYVRPEARGHGVANALMDAVEAYVRGEGVRWLYLDTFEGLKAAVALYQKRGYAGCARYNDNPQATLFMRKRL